ncbi:putative arylmalonate decarboxylase [Trematosphaeria pertusa]|uniref:Putative arylmalonate decarboxylase n=1 Tax=Trematosphaeria pertusa TaxID=390896 RepID=A0A6A6ITV7_9PLEO|nr:putative arylmalonate decarboxylase [Trematosphaeria pertusa]KAF2253975.1 putative arylmalonate decarboxylase [Trematosphaeria pertusa]
MSDAPLKPRRIRIGILVPSSNTALEPLTTQILASIPSSANVHVTAHFSRFKVTTIGLSDSALAQFDHEKMLEAAQLLADANVDVIGWSGTSAGWLGFSSDEQLCQLIQQKTGIPATTSILALNKALEKLRVRRLALVTPYTVDVQKAIIETYASSLGIVIAWERHLSRTDNVHLAALGAETLDPMVDGVVKSGGMADVEAVTTFCTNLSAAAEVERWEGQHGVPVLDTVTTVVWDCLKLCGLNTGDIKGWGRIMRL